MANIFKLIYGGFDINPRHILLPDGLVMLEKLALESLSSFMHCAAHGVNSKFDKRAVD